MDRSSLGASELGMLVDTTLAFCRHAVRVNGKEWECNNQPHVQQSPTTIIQEDIESAPLLKRMGFWSE